MPFNHTMTSMKKNLITLLYVLCGRKMKCFLIRFFNKISVPSRITLEKPRLFRPSMIELPNVIGVSPLDFIDTSDRNKKGEVDEIVSIFLSDLKDITFSH